MDAPSLPAPSASDSTDSAIRNPKSTIHNPRRSALFLFSAATAAATLLLIVAGALVTSLGVGMAVPDWPTTFGQNLFAYPWFSAEGGVFVEHGHRLLGSGVGLLTLVLCGWLLRAERRAWVCRLGVAALALVIVQGVLGGLRVIEIDVRFAIVHGCLAQAFFGLTAAMALFHSRGWIEGGPALPAPAAGRVRALALAAAGAILVQTAAGAMLRHTGAGPFLFLHLALALAVAGTAVGAIWPVGAGGPAMAPLAPTARLLVGLLGLQVALGMASWKTTFGPDGALLAPGLAQVVITVAHVAVGSAMFATAGILALKAFRHLAITSEGADALPPSHNARWGAVSHLRSDAGAGASAWPAEASTGAKAATAPSRLQDYVTLSKPRILFMALLTVLVGGGVAAGGSPDWMRLAHTMAGTALVAAGASALNQLLERDVDARMRRTENRPLPAGRIAPAEALAFGAILPAAGLAWLSLASGVPAAALAAATLVGYVFVYTPLKRRTTLNTAVGAVPGALPVLIGWVSERGTMDAAAASLFAIVFLWQFPHFLAIARLYREEYARAGLCMLPVMDLRWREEAGMRNPGDQENVPIHPRDSRPGFLVSLFTSSRQSSVTGRQAVHYAVALLPASLLPALLGLAGPAYAAGAFALGIAFAAAAVRFALAESPATARSLLRASVVYLPMLLTLLLLDLP